MDKNAKANARAGQHNMYYVPTVYYDDGETVTVGAYDYASAYQNAIHTSETRAVEDIDLIVGMNWIDNHNVQIDVAFGRNTVINVAPTTPSTPLGEDKPRIDTVYQYSALGNDPENDGLFYFWDWGDGTNSGWLGPYANDSTCEISHSWDSAGDYHIKVITRDPFWYESAWSDSFTVAVGCCINRGNVDGIIGISGPIDVSDLTYLVNYLFQQGPPPPCDVEGNIDGITGVGGPIDVTDLTYLVNYLFQSGPPPPACD